jgi:hypothetical protein
MMKTYSAIPEPGGRVSYHGVQCRVDFVLRPYAFAGVKNDV